VSEKQKGRAQIIIAPELVRELLMLPRELTPTEVALTANGKVVVVVESDHLPEVPTEALPTITPIYVQENKRVKLDRIEGYAGPMSRSTYRATRP
jgi:hypothetical protein